MVSYVFDQVKTYRKHRKTKQTASAKSDGSDSGIAFHSTFFVPETLIETVNADFFSATAPQTLGKQRENEKSQRVILERKLYTKFHFAHNGIFWNCAHFMRYPALNLTNVSYVHEIGIHFTS